MTRIVSDDEWEQMQRNGWMVSSYTNIYDSDMTPFEPEQGTLLFAHPSLMDKQKWEDSGNNSHGWPYHFLFKDATIIEGEGFIMVTWDAPSIEENQTNGDE